ncbi:MAG: hypothetical protein M1816_002112 [Peltula sp. TS41687]|nr:MAG: hypothetical protein M1816_002112 [Peltula sp. TS41687]
MVSWSEGLELAFTLSTLILTTWWVRHKPTPTSRAPSALRQPGAAPRQRSGYGHVPGAWPERKLFVIAAPIGVRFVEPWICRHVHRYQPDLLPADHNGHVHVPTVEEVLEEDREYCAVLKTMVQEGIVPRPPPGEHG